MKVNILSAVLILFVIGNLHAINPISIEAHTSTIFTVQDYLDMDYKEYREITGSKWVLGDRLKHKATKRYLEYQLKQNRIEAYEDLNQAVGAFDFKWGAFFLGFFLNILGIILVLLFYGSPRKDALVSWLIGFLIGSVGIGVFLR
ncbi:hypothetical protein [Portibacter marinus]|uniref:hypothetical protein n=1 Tax=Portibacter marinus TaxID=2898660 RepID=UPI001F2E6286|nr:hypothetical protein [Portibacter marinus]